MKNKNFGCFVDRKKREGNRQLGLIQKLLEKNGLKVENFLTESDDDPYIFCISPEKNGGFDGIRIYKIGDDIAFRIQKENKTHPYGSAYPLPIEEMFHDFIGDRDADQIEAGKKVIKAVVQEIRRFFNKTIDAEREERERSLDAENDSGGSVLVRTSGTDYSSLVYSKGG